MSLYVGHCDVVSPLGAAGVLEGAFQQVVRLVTRLQSQSWVKFDDPAVKRMLHAGKIVVGMCPPPFDSS